MNPREARWIALGLLSVSGLLVAGRAAASAIPGLYPTGVDANGALLGAGKADPHYVLFASADKNYPGPDAVVADPTVAPLRGGPWCGNSGLSQWISPQRLTVAAIGSYTYRFTFTLANVDPATATVTWLWAADTNVSVQLNGVAVGAVAMKAFAELKIFNIPVGSPFIIGQNTIDFIVDNAGAGGTTGLQIEVPFGDAICTQDAQCPAGSWCNNASLPGECRAKFQNGSPLFGPKCLDVARPIPGTVGSRACLSGACDAKIDFCGIALDHGVCTSNAQCTNGQCIKGGINDGKCETCVSDADCARYVNTPACNLATSSAACASGAATTRAAAATRRPANPRARADNAPRTIGPRAPDSRRPATSSAACASGAGTTRAAAATRPPANPRARAASAPSTTGSFVWAARPGAI